MYPPSFDYYDPETVDEAIDLLVEHSDAESALLAGGHSLIPAMKAGETAPDVVIDIGGIDSLTGITNRNDVLKIGATTTYADLLSADVRSVAPVIVEATSNVGDTQVRNRGTIGGNLAYAGPEQDLPGAALAAGATLVCRGPDESRRLNADAVLAEQGAKRIRQVELLTRIELDPAEDCVGAYVRKTNPVSGYALVGVGVRLQVEDGQVTAASVGANGLADNAVRLDTVADELVGGTLEQGNIEAAAGRATDGLGPVEMRSNAEASAEFREQLAEVYTERALSKAASRTDAVAID